MKENRKRLKKHSSSWFHAVTTHTCLVCTSSSSWTPKALSEKNSIKSLLIIWWCGGMELLGLCPSFPVAVGFIQRWTSFHLLFYFTPCSKFFLPFFEILKKLVLNFWREPTLDQKYFSKPVFSLNQLRRVHPTAYLYPIQMALDKEEEEKKKRPSLLKFYVFHASLKASVSLLDSM